MTPKEPIYLGFSILDLSKLLMYKFHYKYIKRKSDAKLLFTDTEDVYEDFYGDKIFFDFSDYTLDSKFFDPANKKSYWQNER